MAAQRSVPGTIIFVILALVHSVSVVYVVEQLVDYYYLDWVHVFAQLMQVALFAAFIYAIFKPILKTVPRLTVRRRPRS